MLGMAGTITYLLTEDGFEVEILDLQYQNDSLLLVNAEQFGLIEMQVEEMKEYAVMVDGRDRLIGRKDDTLGTIRTELTVSNSRGDSLQTTLEASIAENLRMDSLNRDLRTKANVTRKRHAAEIAGRDSTERVRRERAQEKENVLLDSIGGLNRAVRELEEAGTTPSLLDALSGWWGREDDAPVTENDQLTATTFAATPGCGPPQKTAALPSERRTQALDGLRSQARNRLWLVVALAFGGGVLLGRMVYLSLKLLASKC